MHRGKVVAAAVVAAVVLLMLVWGSGSGTTVLSSPSGQAGPPESLDRQVVTQDTEVQTEGPREAVERTAPALDWLLIIFAIVVLVLVVKFLQWLLNRDWEQSEAPEDDDLDDDLELLLRATSQAARSEALTEGEPRNVVVRCWVALEDAAAGSGLERDASETSAEFTGRLLDRWEVDPATTRELAELYREARFSRHPVPTATGERAVALVAAIHDQLRARAPGETTDPAAGGDPP